MNESGEEIRVLMVEDDLVLGAEVRLTLADAGYAVEWLREGGAAVDALTARRFDLAVLDMRLPGTSGLEIVRGARRSGIDIPILILTAEDGYVERVIGLDAGADDYLTKPFDKGELLARLRALLRRVGRRHNGVVRHGELVLDPGARSATRGGHPVELTPREFDLLLLLIENAGRMVARRAIFERLYGDSESDDKADSLKVYVHNIRRRLGSDFVHTVRGVGYMVEEAR